ncbi:hypothetical protein GMRT_13227 [Giardia muris]|uniref:Uncharacterized protein n=1 Tax=Giardia muris TaxID=5742 RepID=A0A4Z1T877_GIAMU|nr:hypothetical protein GMRT_13227 [Giardia muris]|eukprot:TNJ28701.1 hypothetical protein GMRT_13227 [Giardia muris]
MTKASGVAGEVVKWFLLVGAAAAFIADVIEVFPGTDTMGGHIYSLFFLLWIALSAIADFGTSFGDNFIENYWSGFMKHHLFHGFMVAWWALIRLHYTQPPGSGVRWGLWVSFIAFIITMICAIIVIIIGGLAMCGVV